MKSMSPLRIFGAFLIALSLVNYFLVGANNHTRLAGGHDLRPLLFSATLMLIGGLGLISSRRWARTSSSILIACAGGWVIGHSLFVSPIPQALFSVSIGAGLFIPLFLTVIYRLRAGALDKSGGVVKGRIS